MNMTKHGSTQWQFPLPLPLPFGRSNVQNFLHTVTPVVPSTVVPPSCIGDINNCWVMDNGNDSVEYFILEDLWKSFDDWSAIAVGTPVVLNHSKTVMQYFVPYLSAVQIYTAKSSSDGSESDDRSGVSKDHSTSGASGGSSSCDTHPLGNLYFEHHEVASPIWRIPIFDKIMEFVPNHPKILTLRSIDLSPASWMSVAWYPIYSIPTSYKVRDLGTSFLTYHTLSSSFQDSQLESIAFTGNPEDRNKGKSNVRLPAFGLAAFKMTGEVWMNHKYDRERLLNLYQAADSWMKQLNFHHHDFEFFKMHN